jgi:hypothetical protein
MLTHDDLSNWFEDLQKIIFDTKISIDNIKRITHPTDDLEKYVLNHGFFSHCYRQSRFTIVVQLCKVFDVNSNQKRNFYKLFNRLSSEKYDKTLMEMLKRQGVAPHLFANRNDILNEIKLLTDEIEAQKELIERIVNLRDTLYAHSDPDSSVPHVSNPELEVLINLAIKTYNNLYGKLYDSTLVFEYTKDWKVDYPIKALAKLRKLRLDHII